MPGLELRPRQATEIVDAAFQLYRRHFLALLTLSTAVYTPYIILQIVLTGGDMSGTTAGVVALMMLGLVGWMFGSISEAAIVVSVSNSYLRSDPDVSDALRRTLRRFGAVMFAVLVKWLLIAIGFVVGGVVAAVMAAALVGGAAAAGATPSTEMAITAMIGGLVILVVFLAALPLAVFFFARYFAVPATVILEGVGVREGLRRSSLLSQGLKRKVLGALGLPYLLFFIIQLILMAVLQSLPLPAAITLLLHEIPMIALSPLLSVIATLLYYDARIRKEGFDIEIMAAELGSVNPGAHAPQVPATPA